MLWKDAGGFNDDVQKSSPAGLTGEGGRLEGKGRKLKALRSDVVVLDSDLTSHRLWFELFGLFSNQSGWKCQSNTSIKSPPSCGFDPSVSLSLRGSPGLSVTVHGPSGGRLRTARCERLRRPEHMHTAGSAG